MYRTTSQPHGGGRRALRTPQQEQEICHTAIASNTRRLREIQTAVLEDNGIFADISSVSLSMIDRELKRQQVTMRQLYKVPFERNCDRVKELRYQYVQVKYCCALHTLPIFSFHYGPYTYCSCRGKHRARVLCCVCKIPQEAIFDLLFLLLLLLFIVKNNAAGRK